MGSCLFHIFVGEPQPPGFQSRPPASNPRVRALLSLRLDRIPEPEGGFPDVTREDAAKNLRLSLRREPPAELAPHMFVRIFNARKDSTCASQIGDRWGVNAVEARAPGPSSAAVRAFHRLRASQLRAVTAGTFIPQPVE